MKHGDVIAKGSKMPSTLKGVLKSWDLPKQPLRGGSTVSPVLDFRTSDFIVQLSCINDGSQQA